MKNYIYSLIWVIFNLNHTFANSYVLNGDLIKSDANKSIQNTSIVLYIILVLIGLFGGFLVYTNNSPKIGKILILIAIICLLVVRFASGTLQVFNSSTL